MCRVNVWLVWEYQAVKKCWPVQLEYDKPKRNVSRAKVKPNHSVRGCCNKAYHFDCLKRMSKSVQVLFNGMEAVMVLTLRYHIPSSTTTPYTTYHLLSTVSDIYIL